MERLGGKLTEILCAVIMMFFILSAAVTLTLVFKPLYRYDMEKLRLAEETGYSEKEILENYDALIQYNVSPFEKELRLPTLEMSEEGQIHFEEVKVIFQFFLKMFLITAVLAAIITVVKTKKGQYGYLKLAGILTLIVPSICGVFVAANWERAFVLFHELVFANDYWLFDPATDPVILLLPDAFFLHCAVMILLLAAVGAAVCFVTGVYRERSGRKITGK